MSILPPSSFFPPAETAGAEGLVAIGGLLEPAWLLDAYRHGIFPWPFADGTLAWWSPDPRAVVEFDRFHVPRRLARTWRSGKFTLTCDRAFAAVLEGCATAGDRRGGTWLTDEMQAAYVALHEHGVAHSVEAWREGRLAGGTYGVGLGAFFSAESMFYRVPDASKVALAALVAHLQARGYELLDIQQLTPHMQRMGASTLRRRAFLRRLAAALREGVTFGQALEPPRAGHAPPPQDGPPR
jgi:leucyl/phenylalanyl-tRNA--protein transferase